MKGFNLLLVIIILLLALACVAAEIHSFDNRIKKLETTINYILEPIIEED